MGNIYSAQNVAAYFIYELNEQKGFINSQTLQQLLAILDKQWQITYGHSVFLEETFALNQYGYVVREVEVAYKENGNQHIELPAKDWYLEYGQFQLAYRAYGIPPFTKEEERLVKKTIEYYETVHIKKVS
ncbi:hypothetical protein [Lysinibacillus sp. BW-2-10]|uniref:hypothetical protein n=1 Tax=Lysinibacillus sp. BW-2-10 TaxID=2590030 RepID=UPI00117F4876|nr:hypothetical protein [Lysinibacillus sp. BW-2-10]TSI06007.1 hypothetical protein FJQ64_11400 [Lysinibacillus sp. BW-2-10]